MKSYWLLSVLLVLSFEVSAQQIVLEDGVYKSPDWAPLIIKAIHSESTLKAIKVTFHETKSKVEYPCSIVNQSFLCQGPDPSYGETLYFKIVSQTSFQYWSENNVNWRPLFTREGASKPTPPPVDTVGNRSLAGVQAAFTAVFDGELNDFAFTAKTSGIHSDADQLLKDLVDNKFQLNEKPAQMISEHFSDGSAALKMQFKDPASSEIQELLNDLLDHLAAADAYWGKTRLSEGSAYLVLKEQIGKYINSHPDSKVVVGGVDVGGSVVHVLVLIEADGEALVIGTG